MDGAKERVDLGLALEQREELAVRREAERVHVELEALEARSGEGERDVRVVGARLRVGERLLGLVEIALVRRLDRVAGGERGELAEDALDLGGLGVDAEAR